MRQRTELLEDSEGFITYDRISMSNIQLSKFEFEKEKMRLPELVDFKGEININPTAFLRVIETFKKLKIGVATFKITETTPKSKGLIMEGKTTLIKELKVCLKETELSEENEKDFVECNYSINILNDFLKSFKKDELMLYDYISVQLNTFYPICLTLKSKKDEIKDVWLIIAPIVTED